MEPEEGRVRLHWANGRVTEMRVAAKVTIIRVPTEWGTQSFRATGDTDDEGCGVFVEETQLPPVAD